MKRLNPLAAPLALAMLAIAAAADGPDDVLARARTLMARRDAAGAVALLETALPTSGAGRPRLVELLRSAYDDAAHQADAAGRPAEAEEFRELLRILNRKPRSAPRSGEPPAVAPAPSRPDPAPEPPKRPDPGVPGLPPGTETPAATPARPVPAQEDSVPLQAPIDAPPALPEPAALPPPSVPVAEPNATPAPSSTHASEAPRSPGEGTPGALRASGSTDLPIESAPQAAPDPSAELARADEAFRAKRWPDAGAIYGRLAGVGALPKARNDQWAYCRWVAVVARINARPSGEAEWARIDEEIASIRKLSPKIWFGEYLRQRAAERRPGATRPGAANGVVVRGSQPDEPRTAPTPVPATPRPQPTAPRPRNTVPRWQVHETANFRVHHDDPELARRVAEIAERVRDDQIRRWEGDRRTPAWSPRCDIYLYPSARVFGELTGQPEESPGFSTMGVNAGKVIARRVNLRADHPNMVAAVLPHEVTHVVLADLFTTMQIPRWADEGMAVLAEPEGEQRLRAADLNEPLASGRLFRAQDLMTMDYPDAQYWSLYYAQSVSLTRFLVEQASPARFIEFLKRSQQAGYEEELRRTYGIDGFAALQERWAAYAREQGLPAQTADATAASEAAVRQD